MTDRQHQSPVGDGWIALCIGTSGMGKTTLAARLIKRELEDFHRRVVLLDPTGDVRKYLSDTSAADTTIKEPIKVVHSYREVKNALLYGDGGGWMLPTAPYRIVALTYKRGVDDDQLQNTLVEIMDQEESTGLTVLIDEAELFFANTVTKGARLRALKLHRNRGQRLIGTMHRPQLASPILRQLTSHVMLFAVDSRTVIESGMNEFGDVDLFERAYDLKRFEYLYRPPPATRDRTKPLEVLNCLSDPLPF